MFFTNCQRFGGAAVLLAIIMSIMLLGETVFVGDSHIVNESSYAFTYESDAAPPAKIRLQEEQTYTAVLPHDVSYYYCDALPKGMEQVLTEGRDGELLCTALVTYVDGIERSREQTFQQVITNPIEEVIAVGTGLRADGSHTGNVVIEDGTITLPTGEKLTYTDTMQVRATGYTHTDAGCDTITATGTTVRIGTVAVDPRYIPYGTRMFIVSNDGSYIYGISVAEDCGGAIKGDRIDLYFPTTAACFQFGFRDCTIYFLG